jgi:hypothetical protein
MCLKSSGKLILDSYYNLNKNEVSLVDIEVIKPYLECSNFMLQKVFCFKQRLFNSNKANTVALKPHMVLHFISFIIFFGSIKNYDTSTSEHLHKGTTK